MLEKFKSVQERARRAQRAHNQSDDGSSPNNKVESGNEKNLPEATKHPLRPPSAESATRPAPPGHKTKSSLGNFSRLTGGVGVKKTKK